MSHGIEGSGVDRNRELVHSRVFAASRGAVWAAWTDANAIGEWWGPKGFTTTTSEMEVRPGGRWKYVMHGPDGRDYPNLIIYGEVVRPERLTYSQRGGLESDLVQFHVTVTFVETDGGTEVHMRQVFPTVELRETSIRVYGAVEGAKQTFERLAAYLGDS